MFTGLTAPLQSSRKQETSLDTFYTSSMSHTDLDTTELEKFFSIEAELDRWMVFNDMMAQVR